MDNFKRHKNTGRQRYLDGIINDLPGRSKTSGSVGSIKSQLDNFKKPDGFKPRNTGSITGQYNRLGPRQPNRNEHGKIDVGGLKPGRKAKKHFSTKKVSKALVTSVLLFGIIGGGYLFGKGYLKALQIFKGGGGAAALEKDVDPSKLRGEGDGRVNILLLGKGGPGHEAPDLTDTILIASIDPIHKEAALLSLPRDFYISKASNHKLNAVYSDAKQKSIYKGNNTEKAEEDGLEAVESTIEGILGIPMHYHAMVDFTGFKKAIDTVGGIDINVETPVYDNMHINGKPYLLNVKTGMEHFDGTRALMYARSRKTSARGDFDRSERQRLVLIAMQNKIFTLGTFGNPLKLNQLFDAFGDHVRTNITVNEMLRLYEIGGEIKPDKVESVGLADPPNDYITTGNLNGISIVKPKAGLSDYSEIQNFVRNKLRDGFLRKEEAVVSVFNGTDIDGLASKTAKELKSYGYNIDQVANSPIKNQQTTTIVYLAKTDKKYTQAYLEKRFGTMAVKTLPDSRIDPGNADFVIILGKNEQGRLQQ